MDIQNSTVVVTGANRGIGRSFVEALLERGASKIYAAARRAESLDEVKALAPDRIEVLELDITKPDQVAAAASAASDATLLINNAGVLGMGSIVESDFDVLRRDMETNYFGTANMVRAFAPVLESNGGGAIANVLSVVSLAPMTPFAGYCASKAAAFSLTQAIRSELGPKGISVHGVYPGPVDTDMTNDFEMDKATPAEVANEALDGIAAGAEDIFADAMAKQIGEAWLTSPKSVEAQFASAFADAH